MKEFFERHKDRLSPEEKQAVWAALQKEPSRPKGLGDRLWWTPEGARRRFLWAYPAFGVLATAVLVVVLMHNRGGTVPGLAVPKPDEITGGENKPAVMALHESIPAGPEQGAPPAPRPAGAPVSKSRKVEADGPATNSGRLESPPNPGLRALDAAPATPPSLQTVPAGKGGNAAGRDQNAVRPSPVPETGGATAEQIPQRMLPNLSLEKKLGPEPPAATGARGGEVTPPSPVSATRAAEPRPAEGRELPTAATTPAPAPSMADDELAVGGGGSATGSGMIQGKVRAESGSPVAWANVRIQGSALGAFSVREGTYEIRHVPPGSYTLLATAIGFEDGRLNGIQVSAGRPSTADFVLRAKPASSLMEGEVVARRESGLVSRGGRSENLGAKDQLGSGAGSASENVPLKGKEAKEAPHTWGAITHQYRDDKKEPPAPAPSAYSAPPTVVPSTGGTALPNDTAYDSMFFKHYGVNPFVAVEDDPVSTFAVDVDAASYTVARRYIELGHLPPAEAVRVEEFVNFFPQDYPHFSRPDFRILVDGAPSPFGKGYQLLRVGLKAREIADRDRQPARLVFVIDVSGSMERENRLGLVQRSLRLLVDQLRPEDRVGIVVFGTRARVLLNPVGAGDRREILEAIDDLRPEGSTNTEEGLLLGYEMARSIQRPGAINRIILCSDGVANEGRTGAESILAEARRHADKGIQLWTIGFGMGNYNDVLMEQLADQGDGNYYYVDNLEEARRVLVDNLSGTLQTVARDAKVQVEFDRRRVLRYRLVGFENRDLADRDFRNNRVDAGEIGAGQAVTALYEVKLAEDVRRGTIATVRLRYAKPGREHHGWDDGEESGREDDLYRRERNPGSPGQVEEMEESFDASDLEPSFRRAAPAFRLDAAVAEFAEILRGSFWAKESRLEDLLPMAQNAADDLGWSPAAVEFVQLVERATEMQETLTADERDRIHPGYPDEGPDQRRGPDSDWDR